MEKQGLVDEAATYYMESLERKSKNEDARIKLKEVGQKHINNLSSEFFREFSTQQYEQSLETFDKLKAFTDKSATLSVTLNYPQAYSDDYALAMDYYLNKYYNEAADFVNQGNYDIALKSISKIKKYNSNFKNTKDLEITATCEPLYQLAIKNIESKNYSSAKNNLASINNMSSTYKDVKELTDLTDDLLKTSFLIFQPKNTTEKEIEEKLFNNFIELAYKQNSKVKLINNTPFLVIPEADDISNAGNVDLIQAIRKATGADFFYVFDVANKREQTTNPPKGTAIGYEKVITKKDTVFITDYKATTYNQITAQRSYSYDFKYKVIDALSNQVITSRSENCVGQDNINYNEFARPVTSSVDRFFPYNPLVTPFFNQYNPNNWRNAFSGRKELKAFADLRIVADNNAINLFGNTLSSYITK